MSSSHDKIEEINFIPSNLQLPYLKPLSYAALTDSTMILYYMYLHKRVYNQAPFPSDFLAFIFFHSIPRAPIIEKHAAANATSYAFVNA